MRPVREHTNAKLTIFNIFDDKKVKFWLFFSNRHLLLSQNDIFKHTLIKLIDLCTNTWFVLTNTWKTNMNVTLVVMCVLYTISARNFRDRVNNFSQQSTVPLIKHLNLNRFFRCYFYINLLLVLAIVILYHQVSWRNLFSTNYRAHFFGIINRCNAIQLFHREVMQF